MPIFYKYSQKFSVSCFFIALLLCQKQTPLISTYYKKAFNKGIGWDNENIKQKILADCIFDFLVW